MNYFKHKLEKAISGNELYLMRDKYELFCPYSDKERNCGTWCPMFELLVYYEDSPSGGISGANVRICNRNQPDMIIDNFEILEVA